MYQSNLGIASVKCELSWLNNVSDVYLVIIFGLSIGQQCLVEFFRHRLLLPIG
jgi:hypothetical protein